MAPDLAQAEFTRLARGGDLAAGQPAENIVLGISSASRGAVRRAHRESPDKALAALAGTLRKYFLTGGWAAATAQTYQGCVETYISLGGSLAPATEAPTKGKPVAYDNGIIRARPDIVLGDEETGEYEVRVLLWDDLTLSRDAAEIIALPVAECVEDTYGDGKVAMVKVIDLLTGKVEEVAPDAARGRRTDVEALLASA